MPVSGETRQRLIELVRTYDDHPELHRRPMLDEMDDLGGIPAAGELARSPSIDDRFVAEGRVNTAAMKPIARMGYSEYTTVESAWRMRRPD